MSITVKGNHFPSLSSLALVFLDLGKSENTLCMLNSVAFLAQFPAEMRLVLSI